MHLIDPPMHISKDDKIEIDEKLNIIEYGLRKYQVRRTGDLLHHCNK